MLNKFLNNKLNNNSRLLSEAKEKVEQAARKKVDNILGDNIPNPQDLQSQLKNKLEAGGKATLANKLSNIDAKERKILEIIYPQDTLEGAINNNLVLSTPDFLMSNISAFL